MKSFWQWLSRRNPFPLTVVSGVLLIWAFASFLLYSHEEPLMLLSATREPTQPKQPEQPTDDLNMLRPSPDKNPFTSPLVEEWLAARQREELEAAAQAAREAEEAERLRKQQEQEQAAVEPDQPTTVALLYRGMMLSVDGSLLALVQKNDLSPQYVRVGTDFAGGTVDGISREYLDLIIGEEVVRLPYGRKVLVEGPES